jgi:hypothetical protein
MLGITLLADLMPDPDWNNRGRVERNGQALSDARAKVLHASTSMRDYLMGAIFLIAGALASDVEEVSALLTGR